MGYSPCRNGQGADLLGCRDEYHKITPYPTTSGGPNLDKFEILETSESPLPVPQEGFPITLEAEYAHLYGDLKVKIWKACPMVATWETSTTRIIPTCNSRASIYPRKGRMN